MFKPLGSGDYTVRPYRVYKTWTLDTGSNGVYGDEGLYVTSSWGSSEVTNSLSGRYKRSVYDHTNHCYYKYANSVDTGSFSPLWNTFGGGKIKYEATRSLHNRVNVISIPARYFGNSIKPSSVTITDEVTGNTYTDDSYGNLFSGSIQVGNVIYEHGFVICTHTGSEYTGSFLGNFSIQFDSTTVIYEHEAYCNVKESEFNLTTNPTAVSNSLWYLPEFQQFDYSSSVDPTGSYLAPYVTTVGLYDDDLNLIAVGKLAKPIKSLPDFPVNFLVRFDV